MQDKTRYMVCVGRYNDNGRGLGGWWAGGCSLCSSTVRLFRTCRPTRPTVLAWVPVASFRRLVALPRYHADDADTNTHPPLELPRQLCVLSCDGRGFSRRLVGRCAVLAPRLLRRRRRHRPLPASYLASDTPAMLPLAGSFSANSRPRPGKLRLS
jgi:hypothetical protein